MHSVQLALYHFVLLLAVSAELQHLAVSAELHHLAVSTLLQLLALYAEILLVANVGLLGV